MASTLELYDGSTTIDLLGASYNASLPLEMRPAPVRAVYAGRALRGVTREPRTISVRLNVKGSSVADLRTKLRDLDSMLARAERRQSMGHGTPVVLKCQLMDTDADDIENRVMWGQLELPESTLDEPGLSTAYAAPGALLTLVCEPFGRLASVAVTADTLENEQDGLSVNYMDIQNIAGTHEADLQLKVHDPNNGGGNAWNGSKKMWVARRSGERRADDLFLQGEEESSFTEGTNPGTSSVGFEDVFYGNGALSVATASGGQVSELKWQHDGAGGSSWTTGFTNCGYAQYDIAGGSISPGLYRVLVRVATASTISGVAVSNMGFALGWAFGAKSKTPVDGDEGYCSAFNQYKVLDLGELVLEPTAVPDAFTSPTFSLRVHVIYEESTINAAYSGEYAKWWIDYIFLLPLDEGAAIVDAVQSSDRVLLDTVSDAPGVYLLDGSDVVQSFATFTGGPFGIGPEDTRIYVVRDDTGDPSNVQFRLTPSYVPQVGGM